MSGKPGRTRVVTRRGLRPEKGKARNAAAVRRPHKYLADPLTITSEAPEDYWIEDGVIVDETEKRESRKAYDEFTRFWPRSLDDLRAEEASWAAKSGPCVTKQKARTA